MDLCQLFEERLKKIELLNDFIVLYGKKVETIPDIRDISNEIEQIKELLQSCHELLKEFQEQNRRKCQELIEKAQHQQLNMLHILEIVTNEADTTMPTKTLHRCQTTENKESPCQVATVPNVLAEISNTTAAVKITPFKLGEQPVMNYADYVKSPYATKRRMRPLALQFTDFERTIGADEFNKIPG